ncbi:MAG: hypothetical protein Q4D87_07220 [Actinomycetaceae bacterium]|nr:hypothetical protein [Actinomycetaceae bacterium]
MINQDPKVRLQVAQTVIATPGVTGILATRGQLLLGRDVEPQDMIRIKTGDVTRVQIRISISEGVSAVSVLQDLEARLMAAFPTIDGAQVNWQITAASATN